MAMGVFMPLSSMIMITRPMRVSVTTKDQKSDQVGEEASTTDNEYELRIVDLGWFDESSDGFQDDGDTKCDKEDGIEESTENFGSNPLQDKMY